MSVVFTHSTLSWLITLEEFTETLCYQELCLDHGVKKYLVALNCITADKSVMDVFQYITVPQAAAPLTGGVVSRTLFFTTIHAILFLPKEHCQGNKQ